jgi:syntaxin 1B/2/3
MNGNDPNRLLNEVRNIDRAIDEAQGSMDRLKMMQKRAVDETNPSSNSPVQQEVHGLTEDIHATFTRLTSRVKQLKQDPESGNPRNSAQVGKVDRRLRGMLNTLQQQDRDYRKDLKDRIGREYRIVRPDASDAEVREVQEDLNNTQIFSQAVCEFPTLLRSF